MTVKIKRYLYGILAGVFFFLAVYSASGYLLKKDIVITPTKTERVQDRYLIFSDKGVYKNVDDFRFLKFNSSDVYGQLSNRIGKATEVTVTGFRVPFLSWYENIVRVNLNR